MDNVDDIELLMLGPQKFLRICCTPTVGFDSDAEVFLTEEKRVTPPWSRLQQGGDAEDLFLHRRAALISQVLRARSYTLRTCVFRSRDMCDIQPWNCLLRCVNTKRLSPCSSEVSSHTRE